MPSNAISTPQQAALNIVLIGAGRMGRAMLSGIRSRSPQHAITVIEPHPVTRALISSEPGIRALASIAELDAARCDEHDADVVVLAVKPLTMHTVLAGLTNMLSGDELLISLAAGTSIAQLATTCPRGQAIIRAMPNTPALIGLGITALATGPHASTAHMQLTANLLSGCGEVVVLRDEAQLAAVTAISGSGPAYFFALQQALLQAAARLGLEPELADKLVRATGRGACQLAWESDQSLLQLQDNVRSPGGTTAAALEVFEQGHFQNLIITANAAAAARAEALAAETDSAID